MAKRKPTQFGTPAPEPVKAPVKPPEPKADETPTLPPEPAPGPPGALPEPPEAIENKQEEPETPKVPENEQSATKEDLAEATTAPDEFIEEAEASSSYLDSISSRLDEMESTPKTQLNSLLGQPLTVPEFREVNGLSTEARGILDNFVQQGLVERRWIAKAGRYTLTDAGRAYIAGS